MKTAEEKAYKHLSEAMKGSMGSPVNSFYNGFLAGYNEAMKEVKEMKANAQLIAAAPDLLEALLSLMDGIANLPPLVAIAGVLKTEWEQGLKAINKALGK
jgi:hypothetical protein